MKRLVGFLLGSILINAVGTSMANAAPRLALTPFNGVAAGTILIVEKERALYYVLNERESIRYPVAVPKAGMQWSGRAFIEDMQKQPAWSPPAIVKRDNPSMPDVSPGGAPGNPMGAAALLLNLEEIAIHGTTMSMRKSMGTAASYGCIRMLNEDILDLYARVQVGTPVYMVR